MITFLVLLTVLVSVAIAAALVILAGGAGLLLGFADVIVCGLIIWLIVRLFRRRR